MYQKNGIVILTPSEYEKLRSAMKVRHRVLSDALLYTGMRYAEMQKFALNPHWYESDKKIIYLPRIADRKRKRVTPDRYIYLTRLGKVAVDRLFEDGYKYPSYIAFDGMLKTALKRSKLEVPKDATLSVKTFRKTYESWMVATYPESIPLIAMCQGHSEPTAMKYYLNIPFDKDEKKEIREHLVGWIVE